MPSGSTKSSKDNVQTADVKVKITEPTIQLSKAIKNPLTVNIRLIIGSSVAEKAIVSDNMINISDNA